MEDTADSDIRPKVAVLEEIARATERRFDGLDRRFDRMENRFDAFADSQRSDFRWIVGLMLGGFGTLLTLTLGVLGLLLRTLAR